MNKEIQKIKKVDINISNTCFDELIKKYNLEPSNHLVDLLYEALIKEL